MDFEAFESDVWDNVNESAYAAQWGNLDDSDPDSDCTRIVFTIGETWQGTLYGAEENYYGQRAVYLFSTPSEQRQWFDAVVAQSADSGPDSDSEPREYDTLWDEDFYQELNKTW